MVLKLNNLYRGDCLEIMPTIPDKSIDLTVTSPPYDNLRTYNNSLEWGEHIWKPIIKELFRITKDGGVVVWVVGDATIKGSETGTSFKQALYFMECGFNLHDTMIYSSEKPPLTHNRYEQKFEYMFVFSKSKIKTFNAIMCDCKYSGNDMSARTFRHTGNETSKLHKKTPVNNKKIKGNIWEYKTGYMQSSTDISSYQHPASFPEKLANDHIISWSNQNDIVFDPFMGSGTTGKMSVLNNRKFIGIEKEENYFNIAQKRINEAIEQKQSELF